MKKLIAKTESILLYLLPIVVFFSYYPVIRLGANETMNFELSLPLIWLAIFGAISMARMPRILAKYKIWKVIFVLAFPIFIIASVIWSQNQLRGLLTAGIAWLITMSVINIINMKLDKNVLKQLLKLFLGASVVTAVACIIQCVLDVFGFGRDITLLCPGCTYLTLGFPHPNGFAIEPQFMGNLLIAPSIISLYLLYKNISFKKVNKTMFGFLALSIFLIMSLYICFSRGALYSFGIASVIMIVLLAINKKSAKSVLLVVPIVVGCLIGLLLQGVLSEISPTNENFTQGIQRSIHQVSLGIIDIREKTTSDGQQSAFSGYIEESTDIRLNLNEIAINTWRNNNILIGVGIGSSGVSINQFDNRLAAKEIIQNEYITILLELGIIGVILLIVLFVMIFKLIRKSAIVVSILVAFMISLCFFSGLPNVLHIYLLIPILYRMSQKNARVLE